MASRRGFLAGLIAASVFPAPTWADAGAPKYISAARTADGAYVLVGVSMEGTETFRLPLPDRGHAATAHPRLPHAVAFARRPGRFAVVLDCRDGTTLATLDSPVGLHFYGHGTYDATGGLLFTTENDFENGQGRIGVWDVTKGYKRIGEFSSQGIGPHDIRLMPDDTLVIANGGIDTHPETGRQKLNLATMQPNLSYVTQNGELLDQIMPSQHHASIRHLSVHSDGTVAVGMQWQGDTSRAPALIGLHKRGREMALLGAGDILDGYVGSIAFSNDGTQVAATSPRSGQMQIFSTRDRTLIQTLTQPDICGAAPFTAGFIATTGQGQILSSGKGTRELNTFDLAWDNHLVPL